LIQVGKVYLSDKNRYNGFWAIFIIMKGLVKTKKIIALFIVFSFIFSFGFISSPVKSEGGYWKLVATNFNEAESITADNVKADDRISAYSYEIHPGGGNMSTTFMGDTIKGSFSFSVPSILVCGETFQMKLSASDAGSNNQDGQRYNTHFVGGHLVVNYGGNWRSIADAGVGTNTDSFPGPSVGTTKDFTAPGKSDGLLIRFEILSACSPGSLKMDYLYQYAEGTPPAASDFIPMGGKVISNVAATEPKAPDTSKLEDSGCVFSDLAGQVEVCNPIGYDENGKEIYDEEDWHFAKIDEKLYAGTKIKTGLDSGVILSFADMSTFIVKPSTTVILSSPTSKESKLKLAFGNIWVNVKKMVKDGTMDVEMSQAAAGAKGTTFILEETGSSSSVKVIEGTVYFRTKAGNTAEITAGNMAVSDSLGNIQKNNFNISQEASKWGKTVIELQINNKNMKVNGAEKEIDSGRNTVPMIYNSRTLIPIRAVFEAMGGTVGYNDKEQKITLKIAEKTLEMWIGKTELKLNGNTKSMDVAPMVMGGRTMVPVRFVAENFGYDVQWKETQQKIIIQ